ncbi:MAG: metallophosphoesterase family protein [Lachnospiraceae bacterium]|nr:metallophosphoesterase family protein [Lachnospiraceae bacterium]
MRFLHTADLHLFAAPDAGRPCGEDRAKAIRRIPQELADICVRENVDLLLIAGDLFHHPPVRDELKELSAVFEQMSHTRVVMIAGERDFVRPGSAYALYDFGERVTFLSSPSLSSIYFPQWNLEVHGLSYDRPEIPEALCDDLEAPRDGRRHFLLAHGGDAGHLPLQPPVLLSQGWTYVALGHQHRPGISTGGRLAYPGSPEPVSPQDTGAHGYYLGILTPDTLSVTWKPFSSVEYEPLNLHITPDGPDPAELVRRRLQDAPQQILTVTVSGERSIRQPFDPEGIADLSPRIREVIDETFPVCVLSEGSEGSGPDISDSSAGSSLREQGAVPEGGTPPQPEPSPEDPLTGGEPDDELAREAAELFDEAGPGKTKEADGEAADGAKAPGEAPLFPELDELSGPGPAPQDKDPGPADTVPGSLPPHMTAAQERREVLACLYALREQTAAALLPDPQAEAEVPRRDMEILASLDLTRLGEGLPELLQKKREEEERLRPLAEQRDALAQGLEKRRSLLREQGIPSAEQIADDRKRVEAIRDQLENYRQYYKPSPIPLLFREILSYVLMIAAVLCVLPIFTMLNDRSWWPNLLFIPLMLVIILVFSRLARINDAEEADLANRKLLSNYLEFYTPERRAEPSADSAADLIRYLDRLSELHAYLDDTSDKVDQKSSELEQMASENAPLDRELNDKRREEHVRRNWEKLVRRTQLRLDAAEEHARTNARLTARLNALDERIREMEAEAR